jgi:hypothetical protein
MAWVNDSKKAKDSARIRGPSVGAPGREGRGALVHWKEVDGVPCGVAHPDGVLANPDVGFRIASERPLGQDGLRFMGGELNKGRKLQCVRTKMEIPMETGGNILVLGTKGKASEIIDPPEFRAAVDEVRKGERPPLVNAAPHLPGGKHENGGDNGKWAATTSVKALLFKFLVLAAAVMIFNEAEATPEERSRLHVRRFEHFGSKLFVPMDKTEERAAFPNPSTINEDDLVQDLAKSTRKACPKNDPEEAMARPPWWRVKCDGHGGEDSMGGESVGGAAGAHLFVCASAGSTDQRSCASHEQFPVTPHQLLSRVEAEHFACHVACVDTQSANLSDEVEEVAPQEMARAESMARTAKRRSTGMKAGAPHLGKEHWALCEKRATRVHGFLPISSRNFHCPVCLRTGRAAPWKTLAIHAMEAPPCTCAPMDGPIHKRGEIEHGRRFHGDAMARSFRLEL